MNREKPVERATTKYFFARIACESARHAERRRLRTSFRLIEIRRSVEFALLLIRSFPTFIDSPCDTALNELLLAAATSSRWRGSRRSAGARSCNGFPASRQR